VSIAAVHPSQDAGGRRARRPVGPGSDYDSTMPKLLRPRHEFPTPLFLAFCALLAVGAVAWLVVRLVG
jgi:hypothetical protein